MSDLRDSAQGVWAWLWSLVPPAVGAYFGLRYAVHQTPKERMSTWSCSAFLSLYLGQAAGEYFTLGTKSTSGATIIIAMLLSDVLAILVSIARQLIADPVGTFRRWRNAWLGKE
jgi:hypothetical protein